MSGTTEQQGTIAVDLDGTLAHYDEFRGAGHIGAPVPLMLLRVKLWLQAGRKVVIFTARLSSQNADRAVAEKAIRAWCLKYFGQELPCTAEKDHTMTEIWDDRAVGVLSNLGLRRDRLHTGSGGL